MKIVVIGGTGLIGSKVVGLLEGRGHEVIVAVPDRGVNTVTGSGVAEALKGAEVIIDVANSPSFEDEAAMHFFSTAGRNVAAAEAVAGIRHHIALSVVGTERLQGSGYFRAKLVQERLVRESGIPFTIVHACQFFEFLRGIANSATDGEEVRLAHAQFRPMAAADVAAALAQVALAAPVNGTIEIAGPQVFWLDELVARLLAHDGDPRTVIRDPDALYFGVRIDAASLLPGREAKLWPTGFDWWLANDPPPAR